MSETYIPMTVPSAQGQASPPISVPQPQMGYPQAQQVSYPTQGSAAQMPQYAPQASNVIQFPVPQQQAPAPQVMPQGYSTQPYTVGYQQQGNYNSPAADGTSSNPFAQALNKALDLLATPVSFRQNSQAPSQVQEQPSNLSQGQPQPQFQGQPMGVPLPSMGSQTSVANPEYYNNSSRRSLPQRNDLPLSGVRRTDAYYPSEAELKAAGYTLDGVNQFACELEQGLVNMAGQLEATESQMAAARQLMTDPNLLAQYVMEFYGPDGPYPVDEAKDQLAAMQYNQQANYNYRQEPSYDPRITPDGAGLDSTTSRLINPIGYERPNFPAPPQVAPGQNIDISMLSQAYQQNPSEAWKIVDYLQDAGAFRGTVLAMDS